MDGATLLASVMLRYLDFQLTQAQAAAEGRPLSDEEIDTFRQQLLVHEGELDEAIKARKEEEGQ